MTSRRHPPTDTLRAIARGAAAPDASVRHVDGCERCTETVATVRDLLAVESELRRPGACPEPERLVAWRDGTLAPAETAELEAHLAACTPCAVTTELDPGAPAIGSLATLGGSRGLDLAGLVERLRALVAFEPPAAPALALRSTRGGSEAWRSAMADYEKGRWDEAARGLEAVVAAGEDDAAARYFLGCSHLAAGRTPEAVAALKEAVRRRPRLGAYRWALAQAHLQDGHGEAAAEQLRRAARMPGPQAEPAAELAARVEAVLADEEESA